MDIGLLSRLDLVFWIWAFISLGIFMSAWLTEKRRLINGILFNICVLSFLVPIGIAVLRLSADRPNLTFVIIVAFVLVVGLIMLLYVSLVFLLLWNARIVWQREAHTLANSLTLLLGLGIIVLWLVNLLPRQHFLPGWLNHIIAVFPVIVAYVLASFYNYLTNLVLYQCHRPRYRQDYIVVLGAGLLHGDQVSPLLAQRIDRGLKFYHKQKTKTQRAPKMIFSGGQGADERLPEGQAMAAYAQAQGLPAEDCLVEAQSKTTYENMKFSKALIQARQDTRPRVIFVTNNYHTFRAGLYARLAGLPANGIGSKTSKYFLPNAIIREYIAIFMMKKKQHLLVIGAIVALDLLTLFF